MEEKQKAVVVVGADVSEGLAVDSAVMTEALTEDTGGVSPVERTEKILEGSSLYIGAISVPKKENSGLPGTAEDGTPNDVLGMGADDARGAERGCESRKPQTPGDYWGSDEAERADTDDFDDDDDDEPDWEAIDPDEGGSDEAERADADDFDDDDDDEPDWENCGPADLDRGCADLTVSPLQEEAQSWLNLLKYDKNGKLEQTLANCMIIFQHDPVLDGLFGTNDFSDRIELRKAPPWKRTLRGGEDRVQQGSPLMWSTSVPEPEARDSDFSETFALLSSEYGFQKMKVIEQCINVQAGRNHFHPVREYFEIVKRKGWDGKKRIDTLFVDYFGTADTPFLRAITRKTLVAAVSRIFNPGCQFDSILTMQGLQGRGKTMFWTILAGPWYADLMTGIGKKDAWQELLGVMIIELGEMTAVSGEKVEKIKAFVTRKVDRYRKAYGRVVESHPRQCIFVATTNLPNFLKDMTGNRRFWIADMAKHQEPTKDVWKDLPGEVDQIWAEAYALYEAGTEAIFLDKEQEMESERIQQRFASYDPRKDAIEEYLNRRLPADWDSKSPEQHIKWLRDDNNVGTVERTVVCLKEIFTEALYGMISSAPGRKVCDEVLEIVCSLKTPDGRTWHRTGEQKRIPGYKKQRILRLF